jgi:hypothetical protein
LLDAAKPLKFARLYDAPHCLIEWVARKFNEIMQRITDPLGFEVHVYGRILPCMTPLNCG